MSAKTCICPKCATPLPRDAPKGLCPECLLRGGFADGDPAESSSSPGPPRERTIHIVVPLDEPTGGIPEALRHFGDYELLEQIAVGGMGVVFKARQVSLNRLVAVKMIRAGQLAREDDIRRFRTEAEAAANLKHSHIVAIHEVGEHEGRHYFSMDYIKGRSLAELVRDHPLEPDRAARLVQTIAEAIAYAHGRGVLHRDLKPSNVMIDAQGQPHVTDFGLAKLFDVAQASSPASSGGVPAARSDSGRGRPENPQARTPAPPELTQTGAVMGSPSYMSPEQARGRGDQISVRTDVYALGAMLYELLTTRPPFLAATALETMKLVAEREPVAPRVLNPSAPRDLETICLKCLQKEPAHRYASADALAEDLARWKRHEPIHARPSTVWERGVKWTRRNPARAAIVGLSLVAPAVIIAVLIVTSARVTRERNNALRQETRATNALVQAESETRRAETNAFTSRQSLYAADLYQAAQLVEAGQFGPALALLEGHRPKAGEADLRGFEWRYFRGQCEGTQTRVLRGLQGTSRTLAFSADGRLLAADDNDRVLIWNTATWESPAVIPDSSEDARFQNDIEQSRRLAANNPSGMLAGLLNQDGFRPLMRKSTGYYARAANALAFSPDGLTLATGGGDNEYLKFWDVGTRRQTGWIPETFGRIAFLPGTKLAFVGVGFDLNRESPGETRLYDWAAEKALLTLSNSAGLLALSGDGRSLATANGASWVSLWDTATGRKTISFHCVDPQTMLLALSPDGRTVATCANGRRQFHLWDATTGRWKAGGDGHRAALTALAFSPDGLAFATASMDATVRMWNPANALEYARLDGHTMSVGSLAFSPDGRTLASSGRDGTVRLWDLAKTKQEGPAFEILPPYVFSDDGRHLVGLDRAGLPVLWEVDASALIPFCDSTNLVPLFFSATGDTLAFDSRSDAGEPRQLEFWDVAARVLRSRVTLEESATTKFRLSVSRDHRRLAGMSSSPNRILLWDAATGRLERRFAAKSTFGYGDDFSPDGRRLVAIYGDGPPTLLDADTGALIATFPAGVSSVASLAFTPDSGTLITGCKDNLIRLWDANTGALRATLAGHGGVPHYLSVSPDGRTLASVADDWVLKLWNLATRRELATLLREQVLRGVAFSPDGRLLVAPAWGSKMFVWQAPWEWTNTPASAVPANQGPTKSQ